MWGWKLTQARDRVGLHWSPIFLLTHCHWCKLFDFTPHSFPNLWIIQWINSFNAGVDGPYDEYVKSVYSFERSNTHMIHLFKSSVVFGRCSQVLVKVWSVCVTIKYVYVKPTNVFHKLRWVSTLNNETPRKCYVMVHSPLMLGKIWSKPFHMSVLHFPKKKIKM